MSTKFFTILLVTLFSVSLLQAKSKTAIKLNPKKGTTYVITNITESKIDQEMMGNKMKIDQKMTMVYNYLVLDVLPDQHFLIEYSIDKVEMDMNMNGNPFKISSENTATYNTANDALKVMKELKLKFVINAKGKIDQLTGVDEYVSKISGSPMLKQSMYMFADENSFSSYLSQMFNFYPENEVAVGDKWSATYTFPGLTKTEAVIDYELAEIQDENLVVNLNADLDMDTPIEREGMKIDMKMKGTQSGTFTVDPKDGWLKNSDLNQKYEMTMKMKNPQTGEDMVIPMKMDNHILIDVTQK